MFNSFVRALSKSLRHLLEAITIHILLSGDARRNRDDYTDLMLSESGVRWRKLTIRSTVPV